MRRAVIALTAFLGAVFVVLGLGASTAHAEGEALRGTLRNQGQPVAGVKITVETQAGESAGEATSDAQGRWEVELDRPGTYKVTLDTATLPQGVTLRQQGQNSREVQVFEGNPRTVLFPLGARPAGGGGGGGDSSGGGSGQLERIAQLVFDGFNVGLVIALAAMGLSLIFGTTGLTNFAHGELVTLGALLAYLFNNVFGLQLILAGACSVALCGLFGYLQDRFFWGRLRRRGTGLIALLIISIGLALLLRHVYLYVFGGRTRAYSDYLTQGGLDLGWITATPKNLVAMTVEVIVLVAVALALLRTRLGKATRAVADNPSLAASTGIDVDRVIRLVWTVGTAIAGLAGIMLALTLGVNYQLGFQLLLLIFAGVTLGGLGTAFGALVGSVIVGLFTQVSTLWVPAELKNAGALLVLILVLLVRPQGILGRRERIG